MAKGIHTELTFETAIELSLLEDGGYVKALKDNGSSSPIFDTNEPYRTHFLIEIPVHPVFHDQANDQVGDQVGVQVGDQADDQVNDQANDQAHKLTKEQIKILKYSKIPRSNKDIQEKGLKLKVHSDNFKRHIEPLIEKGLLERTIPDKPTSPNQEYFTTDIGQNTLSIYYKNKDSND